MSSETTALIFGATGAVGKQLLKDLLVNSKYTKIVSIGRRNVELEDSVPKDKLVQKVVDFDNLEASRSEFKGVSDVYCCLGTTRADAGGAEQFRKIDQSYVLNSAKIVAEENKSPNSELSPIHFLYCSSTGANAKSPLLYPKTKGETENALSELGFQKVSIFRPGFLEIVEPRTRPRLMERVASSILSPFNNFLNLGIMVNVRTVAVAMHKAGTSDLEPSSKTTSKIGSLVSFFSHEDIRKFGGEI